MLQEKFLVKIHCKPIAGKEIGPGEMQIMKIMTNILDLRQKQLIIHLEH